MRKKVLVVGAGIAGHTLACALAQRNISFDIVEKKPDWEILGAGMYVQHNALRGFQDIGVADEVLQAGWLTEDCPAVLADVDGTEIARTTIPPDTERGLPGYVPCSRPALHRILNAALSKAGGSIRMGTTVRAFDQNDASVDVTFDDGTTGSYELLVGADGINSGIRAAIFPGVKAEYSGFSNWRVILPSNGRRKSVVWQMGPEKSVGIIPISDSELYIAGVTKEPGNPWFAQDKLLDLMRDRFAEFGGEARAFIDQVKRPEEIVYTPINEVNKARPWSNGRVVLVGDAVHASTPFWAQGAAMAVEDVIVLARMLEKGEDIPQMLQAWEERRYDRCVFVQEGSKNTGVRGHAPGEEAMRRAHDHIRGHAQNDLNARLVRLNQPM